MQATTNQILHETFNIAERLERIERGQAELFRLFQSLYRLETTMSAELDALTQQVAQNTDLEQSAVTLIQGLADQINASKDDPAKLTQLTSDLKARADALAAAITTNTPAPPTPPAGP
jgi:hypothetical protein